jgi:hypothetical protein
MTLPSSGAIKFSDIQTEFGGTTPTTLSEYYAGGSYVPTGCSGINGAIPSSGAISVSKFYGASKYITGNWSDVNVIASSNPVTGDTSSVTINQSGTLDFFLTTDAGPVSYSVYKNSISQGQIASISVVSGDTILIRFIRSSPSDGISFGIFDVLEGSHTIDTISWSLEKATGA